MIYRGDSTAASGMKPYNLIPYYGGDPQSFARKLAKKYNSYKDETEKVANYLCFWYDLTKIIYAWIDKSFHSQLNSSLLGVAEKPNQSNCWWYN